MGKFSLLFLPPSLLPFSYSLLFPSSLLSFYSLSPPLSFSMSSPFILILNVQLDGFSHMNYYCSVSQLCPTLRPHGLQHARPPCPSPTPEACWNSCRSSWWCHPVVSSSVAPFSSRPQSGSFPMSQLFTSGGQSIGVSASASVFPMNMTHSHNHYPEKRHVSSIPRKIPCAIEVSIYPTSSTTIYQFHLFDIVWALPSLLPLNILTVRFTQLLCVAVSNFLLAV